MTASPEIGVIGIVALLGLLMTGMPIGVALGVVGFAGMVITLGLEPALIKSAVVTFDTLTRYELGTLPLFLLVAHLAFSANASRDFFDAAARFIGHRRGGLALASISGCAGFSAINGSSLATAATVGLVALPEMRRHGYSDALATGSLAAGGTLGPMIPPSAALIVYGIVAEQSIGTLFTAAILPGISQMLLYFAVIWLLVRFRPRLAPSMEKASWAERWRALARIGDLMLLALLMIAGIVLGWFSPSEAASVGVVGVLLISLLRGRLSWNAVRHALEDTLRTTGFIYVIVIGALIFAVFVSVSGLTSTVGELIAGMDAGRVITLLVITGFLLLLGSVLDGLALMLLTTPILLPIITELGMSPIWFGIFLVRAIEIGFVHPPIGMNLYVIHKIAGDVPLSRIFKGVLPFLTADLLHVLLIILFPALVLALPKWVGQ